MGLLDFLPPEATMHTTRITLYNQEKMLIEQHDGLISYDQICIRLRLRNGYFTVAGLNLHISEYSADSLQIQGKITGVEFHQ